MSGDRIAEDLKRAEALIEGAMKPDSGRVTVKEAAEALEANPYYLALRHAEEKLHQAEKERDEARLSLRLSLAEMALREKERDQLRAENERLNAEIELHRKGEFDDSWQRQCSENERLESENERLREALQKIAMDVCDYYDHRKIAQHALAKGGNNK